MLEVAIVGAGETGGTIAAALTERDLASTIRLVDRAGGVAAGKALDLMQAAAIHHSAARLSGSSDVFTVAGAHVIVLADLVGRDDAEWSGDEGLQRLTELSRIAPESVFLCPGPSQRDLVERSVGLGRLPRQRIFGTAPEALAGALRASVALEADVSVLNVSLTVLGLPPGHTVVPWAQATIDGLSLTSTLDEPALRRLAARVAPLWPPGPQSVAAAAATAIACIAGQSRQLLSCFVAPNEELGRRARAVALPTRLGWMGVVSAEYPPSASTTA